MVSRVNLATKLKSKKILLLGPPHPPNEKFPQKLALISVALYRNDYSVWKSWDLSINSMLREIPCETDKLEGVTVLKGTIFYLWLISYNYNTGRYFWLNRDRGDSNQRKQHKTLAFQEIFLFWRVWWS